MLSCLRCNHQWQEKPEGHRPVRCPKCQSTSWNKPYKWLKNSEYPINIGDQQQEPTYKDEEELDKW